MITTTRSAGAAGTRTGHAPTPRSISDDDLCSGCAHLAYQPGELSRCDAAWPGQVDNDGYIVACATLVPCQHGANVVSATTEGRLPC